MQSNNDLQDIWELYGVKENPFSTSPILVIGGAIPISSFVDLSSLNKLSLKTNLAFKRLISVLFLAKVAKTLSRT